MRKILVAVVLLAVFAVVSWKLDCGEHIVGAALPEFPDFPPPLVELDGGESGRLYYPSATPFDFDVILAGMDEALPTTGVGTLFMPQAASAEAPVPAMVVLHGSGGITPGREMAYGELLAGHGIAAFVVDYYEPRGVTRETNYMLRVLSVTEFDAVTDAYAALRLLATHPGIDGERIGVMGFSYGGMAARFAMDERVRAVLAPRSRGFAAFVDYYGPCFQDLQTAAVNGAPLLTLRGTEDASNDLDACREREAQLAALGVPVETHVYEGAGHAWEASIPRRLFEESPYVAGCTIVYDDVGHSSLNGVPIVDSPPGASREDRIAARMASGGGMGDCVKSGYVIGRDDATLARSNAALLAFLERTFGLAEAERGFEEEPGDAP
jgi:dienelactone hydrolase